MRKWPLSLTILLSLLFTFGILAQSVNADREELEEIRKAIKETGAKWKADETSVSHLTPQERRKLLGTILDEVPPGRDNAKPDKPDKPGKPEPRPEPDPDLPDYYDWRDPTANRLGLNAVTPIKNQGSCGSCWAFGATAALESACLISNPELNWVDLSEQDPVSCCYDCWGDPAGGCGGGYMEKIYNYLRDKGAIDETCFPYVADDVECLDTGCSRTRISDWTPVERELLALQEAIYEQPIPAAFYVYNDFYYYKRGVYSHVERGKPKPILGGHAICIIGWDNENGCLIVKNSWGEGWGEAGFFRVAYTEIDNSVQFGRAAANYGGDTVVLAPRKAALTIATVWGQIKM